jgi:hypothetical protein
MADGVRDEQMVPKAKQQGEGKPYSRPSLRRLGTVRELTGLGLSPTKTDSMAMMAM